MLHCSGRFIPQIISFLSPKLDDNLRSLISAFQENVVKTLAGGNKKLSEEEAKLVADTLAEDATKLKEAVVMMRKGSVSESA